MALTPEAVYAMLKRYVADTAIGFGAVKGAPCTIKKIEKNDGVNTVTFEWTGMDGSRRTSTMQVNDGRSVKNLRTDNDGNLIVEYNDGTSDNLGKLSSDGCECVYTNPGVEVAVGGVKVGDKFDNTPVIEVLDKIFSVAYTKPQVSIGLNPNKNLYSANDPSLLPSSITITANVVKKTDSITKVVFKVGNTTMDTKTTGIADGGKVVFTYGPLTESVKFTVEVSDGTSTVSTSSQINVVGNSYIGYIPENGTIDDVDPSNLTVSLKTTKAFSYTATFPDDGNTYRIVYMYPKTLGALTTIKDSMGFENIQEYDVESATFDNIDYYVYLSAPTGASGVVQNYS